ncbi:MAG TPA: mechanosensitive ion channel domain-containing protein [Azonexus sp.]
MDTLLHCLRRVLLSILIAASPGVQAREPAPAELAPEAVFSFANREIVTLRATVPGGTPQMRVKRIHERLRQLDERDLAQPLKHNELMLEGRRGRVFSIGEQPIFVLYEADLDETEQLTLEAASQRAEQAFRQALAARQEQRKGSVLLRGVLLSAAASVIAAGLLWLIQRTMRFLLARLQARERGHRRWRWAEQAWQLVSRLAQLVLAFLWLAVAYLWFIYVLASFPLTQPFAEQLSTFLVDLLGTFGQGLVAAIPGVATVAVVLFLAKAANDVVANIFNSVDQGRLSIPGVHKDTAHATRRLIGILVWAVGIAIAYPYLPLAESNAFKGLSVMFGFMLTLGSAGLVTQVMSGLVLIYSRALKVGDFVSIGEVTGVVREMGMLSTKFINMRNEEITIPNAVLVGNPINNFTSAGGENGALLSTTVTIGYDTPWRQVHAMLIAAAGQTSGLRRQPEPFVLQKALQDFYVEYELFAYSDRPLERVRILSELHGNIQDAFNAHGVQIMSPHFVLQPRQNVVVPREQWFAEPAAKP